MSDWLSHEASWRLLPFALVFLLMAALEYRYPRRKLDQSRRERWWGNLSLVVLNTLLARLLFALLGTSTVTLAFYAQDQGLGLLTLLQLSPPLSLLCGVLLLDLAIYWQHRLFHQVPWLWRLHQVHHADRNLDVSSGLRFHPLEILLSLLIKMTLIVALGVPPLAVLMFEVLLNGMAMFNHANVYIPPWLDRPLRWLVITPDAHRIHHSVVIDETNSNYGFNLSAWDRLFGSYRNDPAAGQINVTIGLPQWQDAATAQLGWMLRLPFRRRTH